MTDMTVYADMAVELGEVFGFQLDYSRESVFELEKLAGIIYEGNQKRPMSEETLNMSMAMIGAYLGEMLLRSGLKDLGFAWAECAEGEIALNRDEDWFYPITKAHKRITAGPGDDLMMFYMVSLALAGGETVLQDPS